MAEWINFKELRQTLSFEAVLDFYGVELKRKQGEQRQGFCPLPTHQGKGKTPSFSANLERGIWQCFGCGASGNTLDFVCRMEGLSPTDSAAIRKAALIAQERWTKAQSTSEPRRKMARKTARPDESGAGAEVPASAATANVVVNAPLDFELKTLDRKHPYLKARGFLPETIARFGLGYCSRGLLQGRIAIPLADAEGRLIGYAGRLVDDAAICEENPKYLFPGRRERDGVVHEFHKSRFLYHGFAVAEPVDDLIVVEGFASVWWLWQWGYKNVVAVMGSSCSEEQAELLIASTLPQGRLWIFTDADPAGEKCAASVLTLVSLHRFCRWVKPSKGQPTDCTPGDLAKLLWPV